MEESKPEVPQLSVDRRLMKMGGSLVVTIPNEAIEQWDLVKGDEVRITVQQKAVTIEPKGSTKVETISEQAVQAYSREMKGIEAKVTLDAVNSAIHLEFSGENKETMELFVRKLWQNLPIFLRLLGLGSVAELSKDEKKARSGRRQYGKADDNEVT